MLDLVSLLARQSYCIQQLVLKVQCVASRGSQPLNRSSSNPPLHWRKRAKGPLESRCSVCLVLGNWKTFWCNILYSMRKTCSLCGHKRLVQRQQNPPGDDTLVKNTDTMPLTPQLKNFSGAKCSMSHNLPLPHVLKTHTTCKQDHLYSSQLTATHRRAVSAMNIRMWHLCSRLSLVEKQVTDVLKYPHMHSMFSEVTTTALLVFTKAPTAVLTSHNMIIYPGKLKLHTDAHYLNVKWVVLIA